MLARDGSFGLLFGFEGQVQIFQPSTGSRFFDLHTDFVTESVLGFNGAQDCDLTVRQCSQLSRFLFDRQQLVFVQPASLVFAEPRHEGDRITSIQQSQGGLHVLGGKLEVTCDY